MVNKASPGRPAPRKNETGGTRHAHPATGVTPAPTIDRITPGGQVTAFAEPRAALASLIVTGPGHNVWFASSAGGLARITPAGQVTDFTIPLFDGHPTISPNDLAAGPDGSLWFSAIASTGRAIHESVIGQVDPATGAVTEFANPAGTDAAASGPGVLTAGSDGNMWFATGGTCINGTCTTSIARVSTH
jgi:streptogramin lyase